MKITVFGTGAYGISIAMMLSKKEDNEIVLWSESKNKIDEFNKNHRFDSIFPNIEIPQNISITNSYEDAMQDSSIIFLVTSAKHILEVTNNMKKYYKGTPLCIASKGIENTTLSLLSTLVKKNLKTNNIAVISGPTFAIDLINNEPCALAIASYKKKTLNIVKENLENDTLKLRPSSDIIGIQLCGCIKNIIAIAAGILNGLGYSESTRSFLINESLHDIKNIIHVLGGKKKTILSFAGIGDLMLTCSSEKSRNFSFGKLIGETKDKNKIDEYLKNNTVEGYYTLNSVKVMLQKKGIEIPLINIIYDIVNNGQNPEELATFLINKE